MHEGDTLHYSLKASCNHYLNYHTIHISCYCEPLPEIQCAQHYGSGPSSTLVEGRLVHMVSLVVTPCQVREEGLVYLEREREGEMEGERERGGREGERGRKRGRERREGGREEEREREEGREGGKESERVSEREKERYEESLKR